MAELLPLSQAQTIAENLLDYLGTTFALADPDARRALDAFLRDPDNGMFRGPYVRVRLPFRPAAEGWREHLEWYEGFTPYGHQAAAFARLSSYRLSAERPRPQPTLVTTGTGSGKTESFLYPILDHVQRANRAGIKGMKALILYPMNALANDQALRLAKLITSHAALSGITAALYTGDKGPERTTVTDEGLITKREVIRDLAPDILLTNYKMLDQLLLRPADAGLWRQSAHSLQYLVLDEFHTYDGAQGTDVSMLLRRLGLTLKSYWDPTDSSITPEDWERPLGRITPIATSATLGDRGDPSTMLEFAETVFGETFTADAVITESRLDFAEWAGDAEQRVLQQGWKPATLDRTRVLDLAEAIPHDGPPSLRALAVLRGLYDGGDDAALTAAITNHEPLVLDLVKAHNVFRQLTEMTAAAVDLDELGRSLFDPAGTATEPERDALRNVTVALVDTLSHVRAHQGRAALSVDVHLWIREVTRISRAATGAPHFVWEDDGIQVGAQEETTTYLPAVYCRHCNRSGWGITLAPTGWDLDHDDTAIRRRHQRGNERFRALIHAPIEAERDNPEEDRDPDAPSRLGWLLLPERHIGFDTPPQDKLAEGGALPVLVHSSDTAGEDSTNDTCPSCRQPDGIRFLGSAIATMLSVSLSTLFGTPELNPAEKRALVFTDSVQDAAHRAGFVQSRSHALTLRTLARQALGHGESDLGSLAHRMIDLAGTDPVARYRLLPPELADREDFAEFWRKKSVTATARTLVRRRLLLDLQLEFGLRSTVGRTLQTTGSAVAHVDVAESLLLTCARDALDATGVQLILDTGPDERTLLAWARGVLEHMRARGAIEHEWFRKFRTEDGNRWWITGGRRRDQGMPGFGKGNSAPGFPVLGGSARDTDLEPVASSRGWYALWTAKVLKVGTGEAAVLSRLLFEALRRRDIVGDLPSGSGARTFHLPETAVVARIVDDREIESGDIALICDTCRHTVHSYPETVDQLDEAPCLVARCIGTMRRYRVEDNFYRQMYAATDVRRVVAREHTSLLPDETRLRYETQFKQTDPPPNAPNVLVATPTLEMGIDIGDLSAVMLSSLPRSVASYLQRVGRAGRLTGNALALAFVTGRGDQLPKLNNPPAIINGAVRPPATYLDAEEILRRQFTASVADVLARRADAPHPRNTTEALQSTGEGSYLGTLIAEAESRCDELVEEFLKGFPPLADDVVERLRRFPRPAEGPGTSELALRCHVASRTWNRRIQTLGHRKSAIEKVLPELEARAGSPAAGDEERRAFQTARASLRLIGKQLAGLRSEYWISALEAFGLFPNYTLLDDTVTLSVSVSWQNPNTREYEHSEFELDRGSAQALRDFAPGSTFYSNGFAIAIDAVDLGPESEHVQEWACCPSCGFVRPLEAAGAPAPSQCPRCGTNGIADVSQRLRVAELRSVSAIIRREEATIDDAQEERARERFLVRALADVDHANVTRRWYVQSHGFGVKHLRNVVIRWVNLGRRGAGGGKRVLGGEEVEAPLFRLCSECGKLDTASGVNHSREHRPWCTRRNAHEESAIEIALARTLTTEGLVLRLPRSITLGDSFAVPSLSAAVLLGLREQIGGDPDHLQIATIVDPSPNGHTEHALLLHDIVPGGTGYLADYANPATVWDLLHRAWQVVRDCECRHEDKLACDRCLLPYASLPDLRYTSRSVAERLLAGLLIGRDIRPGERVKVPATMPWTITEEEPGVLDAESHLEKRFRVELKKRLEALGAAITEKPTDSGVVWNIALGSAHRWTLRPQEYVLGCQPDFLLTYAGGGVPPTAIFTDGWLYHASPAYNRLADDAEKRRNLRDAGYQVIAVTNDDITGAALSSPALRPEVRQGLLQVSGDQLSGSTVDLMFGTAIDLLIAWIQNPQPEQRRRLADWLPVAGILSIGGPSAPRAAATDSLANTALHAIDGTTETDGASDTIAWSFGTFGLAIRMTGQPNHAEVAVVLDDADTALHPDNRDAWREWLRWSNLLNFRTIPPAIATRHSARHEAPERTTMPESAGLVALSGAWLEAYEMADPAGQQLIVQLADAGLPAPVVGEEVNGIPIELSWPTYRVAIDLGLADDEREELAKSGWAVCAANLDTVTEALQKGTA